jgi:hypothetical protein
MPSIEWFKNKIAHRIRKQKYHEEKGIKESDSNKKLLHQEKALWNKNETQKLKSMLVSEHGVDLDAIVSGVDLDSIKNEIAALYEEITVLKSNNPNSNRISEAYQEIQNKKKIISAIDITMSKEINKMEDDDDC